jgi:hypothetical protein
LAFAVFWGLGSPFALDKADLVQHVQVADCFGSLDVQTKEALLQFSGRFAISKYTAPLHVKKDGAGNRISGYYGAGIHGFHSIVLERMRPGLGEFAEAIVAADSGYL